MRTNPFRTFFWVSDEFYDFFLLVLLALGCESASTQRLHCRLIQVAPHSLQQLRLQASASSQESDLPAGSRYELQPSAGCCLVQPRLTPPPYLFHFFHPSSIFWMISHSGTVLARGWLTFNQRDSTFHRATTPRADVEHSFGSANPLMNTPQYSLFLFLFQRANLPKILWGWEEERRKLKPLFCSLCLSLTSSLPLIFPPLTSFYLSVCVCVRKRDKLKRWERAGKWSEFCSCWFGPFSSPSQPIPLINPTLSRPISPKKDH